MRNIILIILLLPVEVFCQSGSIRLKNGGQLTVGSIFNSDTIYHSPPIEKEITAFTVDSMGYLKQMRLKLVILSQIRSDFKHGRYASLENNTEVLVLSPFLRNYEYYYEHKGRRIDKVYWLIPERSYLSSPPINNESKPIVFGVKEK